MKIILFINKDFEANLAYNLLKEELLNHEVKIYYSSSVGKKNTKPKDLLEIEYFEKEFFFKELPKTIKGIKTSGEKEEDLTKKVVSFVKKLKGEDEGESGESETEESTTDSKEAVEESNEISSERRS